MPSEEVAVPGHSREAKDCSSLLWVGVFLCAISTFAAVATYFMSLGHEILDEVRKIRDNSKTPWRNNVHRNQVQKIDINSCSHKGPILVLYLDGHEHQHAMAKAIAQGAESVLTVGQWEEGVRLQTIETSSFDDVRNSSALILGSPVYNANVHPRVQDFINTFDFSQDISNKIGAAFVSAGGISAGEEGTMLSIIRSMLVFRMIVVGGEDWKSAFGASAIVFEDPFGLSATGSGNFFPEQCYQAESPVNRMFVQKAFGLGERVAHLALKLHEKC